MSVDTLTIARNLRAAEMSQPQAEAIASAIGSSIFESSATKSDLAQLRSEFEKRYSRSEIDNDDVVHRYGAHPHGDHDRCGKTLR